MRLIGEQELAHLPELPLLARALGRLGRRERVRMRGLEREVPEHEAHVLRVVVEQHLDRRGRRLAARALEVAVLDDDHRRVLGTERVIGGLDGNREV